MRYEFKLTGVRPLLMHFDDVEWADTVGAWRLDPDNTKKKGEQSGDDRRPAWTWLGYCYKDGGALVVPGANLTSCLKKAGARVPLGRQKTFKELAVSGVLIESEFLSFFAHKDAKAPGAPVPWAPLVKLLDVPDFKSHAAAAVRAGFKLDVRRAVVGQSKHVRVRPRFDFWSIRGTLEVLAHEITQDVLLSIFQQAGRVGLGDWHPGSPKSPGPFGMFDAELKKL